MTRSRIFFVLLMTGLATTLVSCKNPCEEAVKKTIACAQGEGLKSSLREERALAIKVCRPHEDQVRECLKTSDCTEFHRCMKKAVVFREATPTRQPGAGGTEATEPEMTAPDMPVIPD
ncbi:MAG: hypothetical protein CVU65_08590 [Deltaproteobacteria bacterium HGW-Deltaproteobacteria-22]|jgi:hypothetical protein|nr:MAG: hypothetical protein CVU65_08590 [Deltaproteobacteria bacterium HGW-Deltaproteobacteria-22]